jgi:hypothetical protein
MPWEWPPLPKEPTKVAGFDEELYECEGFGTVRVSRQRFTLEDAIGSHACSFEALACV